MFIDKTMTRNVITIGPEATVIEAQEIMGKAHIRHLPVVDQEKKLLGMVSDRDIRSAMPSSFLTEEEYALAKGKIAGIYAKNIMTKREKLITISPTNTLEDALLMMQSVKVGAFPVVDKSNTLLGLVSIRDLMRAFINVLGISEPGTLLCILVEEKLGQMKKIVDAITEERVSFGSILVARHWEEDKRAVFPYLLTNNVSRIKHKLEALGFELLNPMEWYLDQLPKS
ncbi:MAG: CBS domain-containing protein [Deltaproteobacteria bacterium]|nr:CBS domain-containing protein [Deltaproteobacteria bacterium]